MARKEKAVLEKKDGQIHLYWLERQKLMLIIHTNWTNILRNQIGFTIH